MTTSLTASATEHRLPVLRLVIIAGLLGNIVAFSVLQALILRALIPELSIILALTLVIAGVCATRWPWAPRLVVLWAVVVAWRCCMRPGRATSKSLAAAGPHPLTPLCERRHAIRRGNESPSPVAGRGRTSANTAVPIWHGTAVELSLSRRAGEGAGGVRAENTDFDVAL